MPALLVQEGWEWTTVDGKSTRVPVIKRTPFRMRPECVYSTDVLGAKDPACTGCRWQQGVKS